MAAGDRVRREERAVQDHDADVLVVGGGPTGLMLAAELRLRGVAVTVLERDAEPSPQVRSLGLHARSLEVLAMRGILDRFLAEGTTYPVGGVFAGVGAGAAVDLDSRHAHVLGIPQNTTDRLLEERARELGADLRRGCEVVGVEQLDDGVVVRLADGLALRAAYAVACDGGRSTVRRLLGVDFEGEPARSEWLLTEAELGVDPDEAAAAAQAAARAGRGGFGAAPHAEGVWRVVLLTDAPAPRGTPQPGLEDVRALLREVAGTDLGLHSPRFVTRFGDATRLAERYRVGRVLLAGDAAHIHPPVGGQGQNLGIQDALNLGWKLAGVVRGALPPEVLDTYEAERRPVAAAVLDTTRVLRVLMWTGADGVAVRGLLAELTAYDGVHRHLVEKVTGTSTRYDLGSAQPLVGRRLPDLAVGDGGLFDRMHDGRGLLLDPEARFAVDGWGDRVDHVTEPCPDLEVSAALLRPDGHVAWVAGDGDLDESLTRWFGAPHG
jgi:2-polyprenyl-6-methoxyphenol hydroxylase-like FAD-dependent oxidoreductase